MVLQFSRLKTLLVVFALVIGHAPPPVHPLVVTSSMISAAATAISAGTSLTGTTLQGIAAAGYRVTCAIQVENWTRYPLLYPTARLKAGVLTVAPTAILPGKREAIAVRKTGYTATGTYGTVSWEVSGINRRVVLMWSAPFNFHFYSNWMGLGMTRKGVTSVAEGSKWFNQMYYHSDNTDLKFKRKVYSDRTDPVIYRDDQFEIVGVMTNGHRAEIKVIFRPVLSKWKNLASTIRYTLEHSNKQPERC